MHRAHVLGVHVAPVPGPGAVTIGLAGSVCWRMLSEDGMRKQRPRENDAERSGQDWSPHDALLSKRSLDSVDSTGWSNL